MPNMIPGSSTRNRNGNGNGHVKPKVLIPEKLSPDGIALLQQHLDVTEVNNPTPTSLSSLLPSYSALIIRSETKVTRDLLSCAPALRVVARAGVGVDNIDVEACTAAGVIVVNSPSGNIVAAAEHTIALLLATARNISAGNASLRAGEWKRGPLVGVEVSKKTLGIVGLGKVGLKVARMATGLGMKVLALDPYASPEIAVAANVGLVKDLQSLLPVSDFLTVHTPLIASTMGLIDEKELSSMKPTARILNVARGGVVDEAALLSALENGTIAGAGLDVFTSEPPVKESVAAKLVAHPKVVATPHLGASTVEAQENVSIDVCTQVIQILRGEFPTSAVNAPLILPEEYRKLQPFVRLVERMGSLYTQHFGGRGGGKVFEMIYEGELASISNTRPLFAALIKGLVGTISEGGGRDVNIVNAALIAKEKGVVINESHKRDEGHLTYASLVTLRATTMATGALPEKHGARDEQIISGYCSGSSIHISRLDRFSTNFIPEGTLIIARNYDKPGKIGRVGTVLGKRDVNIRFMGVGGLDVGVDGKEAEADAAGKHEALMILGVDGEVTSEVVKELAAEEGILDVSLVQL